jgi:hypothetical protein
MVNYQLGKVYKIVGNGFIYVGSTCEKYLCIRLSKHNNSFKRFQKGTSKSNFTSFKCLTDENHYIELLELFPCNSKDELHTCERKWIEQLDCVNKMIPLRTNKEYYQDNKDRLIEKQKQYWQDNRDKILEQAKQYRQNNRDKISEQQRIRYNAKKSL